MERSILQPRGMLTVSRNCQQNNARVQKKEALRQPGSALMRTGVTRRRLLSSSISCTATSENSQAQLPQIIKINPALFDSGGLNVTQESDESQNSFRQLLGTQFLQLNLDFPGLRLVNVDPPIFTVDNLLSEDLCDEIIKDASRSGNLRQSGIGGGEDGVDIRTSSSLAFTTELLQRQPSLKQHLAKLLYQARKLIEIDSWDQQDEAFQRPSGPGQYAFELPQVARYRSGEHFLAHEDAFPVKVSQDKQYQRRATLLCYLNDVSEGGETRFEHVDIDVKPAKGKGLIFFPSFANGAPDHRTLHTAVDAVEE
eukprot:gene6172-7401_t